LVRTAHRTESIAAVVESPTGLIVDSVPPADLWFVLVNSGIVPECDEEVDEGVGLFTGDYRPEMHASLPVVNLSDGVWTASRLAHSSTPSDATQPRPHTPEAGVRHVIRLTANVEQYEVKRFVLEASDEEDIDALSGEELWWELPEIEAEVDEWCPDGFALELGPHIGDRDEALPIVNYRAEPEPSHMSIQSAWQPASSADVKDRAESERVAQLAGANPNNCYCNARAVLRSLPEYADAAYVEGYVVTHEGGIFEHGWLVKDGMIVDPSIREDGTSYFPGLEFSGRDQVRTFLRTERGRRLHGHPFYQAFGEFGAESSSFQEAFRRARECLLVRFGQGAVEYAAWFRPEKGLPWPE